MSGRKEQFGTSVASPVKRFYEWKSDQKTFSYWDKDEKVNKTVFPLKFGLLTERSCVRGWHDDTESGIYSNEVKNTKAEVLNVYSSKPDKKGNTLLATGFYADDIKGKVAGAHYEKAIYGYEEGVGIVKINLKGSGLAPYSAFAKELGKKVFDNVIEVSSFETGKKGKITYHTPNFVQGDVIKGHFETAIDGAFDELNSYFDARNQAKADVNDNHVDEEETDDVLEGTVTITDGDDLPF